MNHWLICKLLGHKWIVVGTFSLMNPSDRQEETRCKRCYALEGGS